MAVRVNKKAVRDAVAAAAAIITTTAVAVVATGRDDMTVAYIKTSTVPSDTKGKLRKRSVKTEMYILKLKILTMECTLHSVLLAVFVSETDRGGGNAGSYEGRWTKRQ